MASTELREELNCSICLNIYKEPVTLPCGHNFCKLCIGNVLEKQRGSRVFACPECRAAFREYPPLHRNTTLCNIAERCRSTQPAQHVTGITCTYCVHAPVPAAKTCLHCEASLCETHLKVHSQSAEHVLTEPTTSLEQRKCSIHNEILKYYCTEEATCICVSCSLAVEHRGHEVLTLNDAYEKKNEKLRNVMDELRKQRDEAEKQVQDLREHIKEMKKTVTSVTEKVSALIMDIRKLLAALERHVLHEISKQEEHISLQSLDQIQKLEIKKLELFKKMGHIEKLQNVTEPFALLQEQESLSAGFCETLEEREKEDLHIEVISGTLQTGLKDIITSLKRNHNVLELSKTLLDVNTSPDILLDVNTASNELIVSSDLKTVSREDITQNRPETPERFEFYPQVLSTRGFTSGRHYWEVETSGDGWIIGMAYPSIDRKGRQSYITNPSPIWGNSIRRPVAKTNLQIKGIQSYTGDSKSWRLKVYNNVYSVMFDSKVTQLNCSASYKRLGIFLDYEAGQLSFYELSDPIKCIHTFTTTFMEPLHVAICVWEKGWVKILN